MKCVFGMSLVILAVFALAPRPADAQPASNAFPIEIVPIIPHGRDSNSVFAIATVVFSPNGLLLLSGGTDGTLKLWDVATGRMLRTFTGRSGSVRAVAFSPDGTRVASARFDATVEVWDAMTGRMLQSITGHKQWIEFVHFLSNDRLLSGGGGDGTAKIWDVASGQLLQNLTLESQGNRSLHGMAVSSDATRIVVGYDDKTLKLWDIATRRSLRTFVGHNDIASSFAFSLNGDRIVSGGFDNTVKLWDSATGRLLRTFTGHSDRVTSVAISPDGTRVLSGSADRTMRQWDAATGRVVGTYTHAGEVNAVSVSPDGTKLLSSDSDNIMRLWSAARGGQLATLAGGSDETLQPVAVSPDGSRLFAAGPTGNVQVWDAVNGRFVGGFGATSNVRPPNQKIRLALSPDAAWLLMGSAEPLDRDKSERLTLWDVSSGRLLRAFGGGSGPKSDVGWIAFSPDGTHVLSAGGGNVRFWNVATGQVLRTLKGQEDPIAFWPDGTRLLSGSADDSFKTFKLWDAATGRVLQNFNDNYYWNSNFDEYFYGVQLAAFSPDGTRLLSGNKQTLRLWDTNTGRLLQKVAFNSASDGNVMSVAFVRGEGRALTTNSRSFKLWDASNGSLIQTFDGHLGQVNSAAFLPDGVRIVSVGDDTTARLWKVDTGELLATFVRSNSDQWIVITSEGFFAASESGARLLSAVRGFDVWSIDQFYQSLYRPDLVREKLAGDPRGLVREAAAKLDLGKVLASGNAPGVTLISPSDGTVATTDQITAEVELNDNAGGIGRVEWRLNGVTVSVEDRSALPPQPAGQPLRLTHVISLDEGECLVEVVAYNNRNLVASLPARATVTAPARAAGSRPRLFVLALGLNDYAEAKFKLNFAVADAQSLADALDKAGTGLYQKVEVRVLRDGEVTRAGIDRAFAALAAQVQPGDVFVFYLAGHGITIDGRYFFVPQDLRVPPGVNFTRSELSPIVVEQGIPQEQWQRWFASIAAKRSVLLLDTCESGSLTGEGQETRALERGAANDRLVQATGRSIITASTDDAPAFEGFRGHGLFTYNLLEALDRADSDGNGRIEVGELAAYVYAEVTALSEKLFSTRQVPQIKITSANFSLTNAR